MRLDFLCPHHRHALRAEPERAAAVWRDCDRRLSSGAALPAPTRLGLAGSALEAADICLPARETCDAFALDRYAATALRLMALLVEAGQRHLGIVVLAGANAMVEQLAMKPACERQAALRICERLTRDGAALMQLTTAGVAEIRHADTRRAGTPLQAVVH